MCITQHYHCVGKKVLSLKMCVGFVWEHRILILLFYVSRIQAINSEDNLCVCENHNCDHHFVCEKHKQLVTIIFV